MTVELKLCWRSVWEPALVRFRVKPLVNKTQFVAEFSSSELGVTFTIISALSLSLLLIICKVASYIISIMYVCMSVCLSDDNFQKP